MSDDRPRNPVAGKHFGQIFATERAPKSHVVVRHLEMYGAKSVLGLSTRLPLFQGEPIRKQRANLEVLEGENFHNSARKSQRFCNVERKCPWSRFITQRNTTTTSLSTGKTFERLMWLFLLKYTRIQLPKKCFPGYCGLRLLHLLAWVATLYHFILYSFQKKCFPGYCGLRLLHLLAWVATLYHFIL